MTFDISRCNEEFAMDKDFVKVIDSEIPKDSVLISVGLPGSWKSPVTEEIAKRKGFQILRSDLIGLDVLKGLDVFDNKVASDPENRKKVYDEMFRQAAEALKAPQRDWFSMPLFSPRS